MAQTWAGTWVQVIAKLGGTVHPRPPTRRGYEKVLATVPFEGVDVQVEGTEEVPGATSGASRYEASVAPGSMRLSADAAGAGSLALEVNPGNLDLLGRAFRILVARTGDTYFDEHFVMKTETPSVALVWLDALVRQAMLSAPAYAYRLDGGVATASLTAVEANPLVLEAAVRAVALLANSEARAAARWQALAALIDARYTGRTLPPRGGAQRPKANPFSALQIEADEPVGRVVVDVWLGKPGSRRKAKEELFTRARCRRAEGNAPFTWKPGEPAPAILGGEARVQFGQLGLRAAATYGEHVTLLYPGLLGHSLTARALIILTAQLAGGAERPGAQGPYR
jgi:hypothetical protein